MAFPKATEWDKFDAVQNAGTRGGFNPLVHLEGVLHENIQDLRPYTLGYFSEADINERTTMGWIFMKTEHFDVDDWNREIGTRYHLHTDGGTNVMYGDNYIMMMHNEHRDKILKARRNALEDQRSLVNQAGAYAHPQDANKGEMLKGAQEISAQDSARYKVQATGTPDHEDKSGGISRKKK